MKEVGLMPSATGLPGGKETGDGMSHYVLPDGRFAGSCRRLLADGFRLHWQSAPRRPGGRNKVAYACPTCDARVWGHDRHVGRLLCLLCGQVFAAVGRGRPRGRDPT